MTVWQPLQALATGHSRHMWRFLLVVATYHLTQTSCNPFPSLASLEELYEELLIADASAKPKEDRALPAQRQNDLLAFLPGHDRRSLVQTATTSCGTPRCIDLTTGVAAWRGALPTAPAENWFRPQHGAWLGAADTATCALPHCPQIVFLSNLIVAHPSSPARYMETPRV